MITSLLRNLLYKFYKRIVGIPQKVHQVKNSTSYDRYPIIFQAVKQSSSNHGLTMPLLSYGCSTGEECFTLREKYFSTTPILGVDIDKRNLQICRKRNTYSDICFLSSNMVTLTTHAPYQVIFCMSVLCRWPDSEHINDISKLYPFRRFSETLEDIHPLLEVGGLLVIYNASFRFSDTALSSKYRVLDIPAQNESGFVHKFSVGNKKLRDQNYSDCIFIKETD